MTPEERISRDFGMEVAWVEAVDGDDQSRWYYVGFTGDDSTEGYRSTDFRDWRTATDVINYERARRGYGPLLKPMTDRGCRLLVRAFNNYIRGETE